MVAVHVLVGVVVDAAAAVVEADAVLLFAVADDALFAD